MLQICGGRVLVPLFEEKIPIYYLFRCFVDLLCSFRMNLKGHMVTASRVPLRLRSDLLDPLGPREVEGCVVLYVGLPTLICIPGLLTRVHPFLSAFFRFLPFLFDLL